MGSGYPDLRIDAGTSPWPPPAIDSILWPLYCYALLRTVCGGQIDLVGHWGSGNNQFNFSGCFIKTKNAGTHFNTGSTTIAEIRIDYNLFHW